MELNSISFKGKVPAFVLTLANVKPFNETERKEEEIAVDMKREKESRVEEEMRREAVVKLIERC